MEDFIAEIRRHRKEMEKTYREKALKMFPWVCARCGRDFSGKRLRELTVHHKDHNHDNNPADGSNWELLCIYCHENEHSRYEDERHFAPSSPRLQKPTATYKPFEKLAAMLKKDNQS